MFGVVGLRPKARKWGSDDRLSILDVYHESTRRVFDWKFGDAARMSTAQRTKYEQHGTVEVFKYWYQ